MRPTRLEVEGFTTFRTPTTIDFEHADLFAITGPTGSGKTSLLDAIVFGLYGNVPRLSDQRSVAPVIAQGMAEAHIRLDFTVGGDTYTATRVVRRTKAGGGTTAEARLESNGAVLAGTADEVTAAVTERLGLTYDHFTKCVVLPQGEFARFLHDKPATRQDLLISLLDLGVYETMAELARRRGSVAASEAAVLQGRLDDVASATPEAIEAAAARVEQLSTLVGVLDAAVPQLTALDVAAEAARRAVADANEELVALAAIGVPGGLDALGTRVADATATLARATTLVAETEAAVVEAERALAAIGDVAELTRWLDAHDRESALLERKVKAEAVAAERLDDVEAAVATLESSLTKLREAQEAEQHVVVEHRVHAVRADLVAGAPCPVCLQMVDAVPDVKAPPAIAKARTARDKAEREHKTATDAHAAAEQAAAVARAKVTDLADEVAAIQKLLKKAPAMAEVRERLQEHARVTGDLEGCRARHAEARGLHAAAVRERDEAAEAEHAARQAFDDARDSVAALKPPARARTAPLLEQWEALATWASTAAEVRRATISELDAKLAAVAAEREAKVAALAEQCAAADLVVARGTEPVSAAREALGRAAADHEALVARAADAERLRGELAAAESRSALARGLATHLDARHFEKWLLDEAMVVLAEGATEMLMALSAEQYSLRVDAKNGAFVVVDHRNADEVRIARTLSGGETFLASLALALSLADRIASLAARGAARLESIFLDEGFGSLDPDTLDVVAAAIEELGASGRMVGVVSHVAELAERVPVRFDVRRSGNASTVERIDR